MVRINTKSEKTMFSDFILLLPVVSIRYSNVHKFASLCVTFTI